MQYLVENNLQNFEFWCGAKDNAKHFTADELDTLESIIVECYPDGLTDTTINDLFRFEFDTLCEWLGLDSEEVYNR